MKIIHCGDLHLDSKMESVLPKEKAKERKNEILMTFLRMVEYARKNWVSVILIAGDLFDTKVVSAKAKNAVLDAIKSNPGITFLYLTGNHDHANLMSNLQDCPENLKFFGDTWTKYEFEDVVISGIELNADNKDKIYDSLLLDSRRVNIVTLHGQEAGSLSKEKAENIVIKNLRDKNIDYLALGHEHSYVKERLDNRGYYAYCGCLEGRGFDECGTKGFVVLTIESGKWTSEFVPMAQRTLYSVDVNVSGMTSTIEMCHAMEEAIAKEDISEDSLVRVVLKGTLSVDAEKDIAYLEQYLLDHFYFGRVKDLTRIAINIEDYVHDKTLKGEFVRLILSSGYEDDVKEKILLTGIKALSGEDFD